MSITAESVIDALDQTLDTYNFERKLGVTIDEWFTSNTYSGKVLTVQMETSDGRLYEVTLSARVEQR